MEFGNEKAVFISCAMILNIFLKIMQFIKLGEHGGGQFFNVPTIIHSYLKKRYRHTERKAVLLD